MADMDWEQLRKLADDEKFELFPEGTCSFRVEEANSKETKKGTGKMINMKCKALDGPAAGRTVWGAIFIPYPGADVKAGTYGLAQGKLNAVGVPLASIAAAASADTRLRDDPSPLFLDKTFVGTIKHDDSYNGIPKADMVKFAPLPFGGQSFVPAGAVTGNGAGSPPPPRRIF